MLFIFSIRHVSGHKHFYEKMPCFNLELMHIEEKRFYIFPKSCAINHCSIHHKCLEDFNAIELLITEYSSQSVHHRCLENLLLTLITYLHSITWYFIAFIIEVWLLNSIPFWSGQTLLTVELHTTLWHSSQRYGQTLLTIKLL